MSMPIQININNDTVQAVSMWHPINGKWVLVSQIIGEEHKFYIDGVEVPTPSSVMSLKSAQQSVHPTAFGRAVWTFCAGVIFGIWVCLAIIGGG